MRGSAFQDRYPDDVAHCYGCGRLNPRGHQLKTAWEGEETVSRFVPEPYHTAIPGYVYGGLIASLIDCHGTGSAAAAAAKVDGLGLDEPLPRFVTAVLRGARQGVRADCRGTIPRAVCTVHGGLTDGPTRA